MESVFVLQRHVDYEGSDFVHEVYRSIERAKAACWDEIREWEVEEVEGNPRLHLSTRGDTGDWTITEVEVKP